MGLDIVELILAVEDEFGIDIPNEVAATLEFVGQIQDHVVHSLREAGLQAEEREVWERVRSLVNRQLGVPLGEIKREAHLIRDLKAD